MHICTQAVSDRLYCTTRISINNCTSLPFTDWKVTMMKRTENQWQAILRIYQPHSHFFFLTHSSVFSLCVFRSKWDPDPHFSGGSFSALSITVCLLWTQVHDHSQQCGSTALAPTQWEVHPFKERKHFSLAEHANLANLYLIATPQ